MAAAFLPVGGVSEREVAEAAWLSSLADETAEGRSIVELAQKQFGFQSVADTGTFVPFTAQTRMSGVDLRNGERIRKGAADSVLRHLGQAAPADLDAAVKKIANAGGTPLLVSRGGRALGVIYLKDIVKPNIRERFAELRRMGIRTVMITGDNPLTAAAIAAEAGVDDFLAEATPENKLALIRKEQAEGRLVAMCGDGSNDAPALAQADVGVAMNSGTPAAKEAGNLIDLDSDPTKLIEIVLVGKQLLISRGALTTFSIANDVAKYFAILPALFVAAYPGLGALNVMGWPPRKAPSSRRSSSMRLSLSHSSHRAERGEIHPGLGFGAAVAQPADLWNRRADCSLHRHQGHRPCRQRAWTGLRNASCPISVPHLCSRCCSPF